MKSHRIRPCQVEVHNQSYFWGDYSYKHNANAPKTDKNSLRDNTYMAPIAADNKDE